MLSRRMKESLDRWITGNYGEDQFIDEEMEDEEEFCEEDCSKCKMKVNYTIFDQEDDGEIE